MIDKEEMIEEEEMIEGKEMLRMIAKKVMVLKRSKETPGMKATKLLVNLNTFFFQPFLVLLL